jgi:hypothetical protein
MRDVLVWVKVELVKRRRKVRDLAAALCEDYTGVSRILNGYSFEPEDWNQRVVEVLSRWDREQQTSAGGAAGTQEGH